LHCDAFGKQMQDPEYDNPGGYFKILNYDRKNSDIQGETSCETTFKITVLPPRHQTQRDDVYFNLGALESLWLNE